MTTSFDELILDPDIREAIKAKFPDQYKEIMAKNVNVKTILSHLPTLDRECLLDLAIYGSALLSGEDALAEDYVESCEEDGFLSQLGLLSDADLVKVMKKVYSQDCFKLRSGGGRGKKKAETTSVANPLVDD